MPGVTSTSSRPRFCKKCRYNLRGVMADDTGKAACPECGHPFDPGNPKTTAARPKLRRWLKRTGHAIATLALLLGGFAGWYAWMVHRGQQQIDELRAMGFEIHEDFYGPDWFQSLQSRLGLPWIMHPMWEIPIATSEPLTDQDLQRLTRFPRIQCLVLAYQEGITNEGVSQLAAIKNLYLLNIIETPADADCLDAFVNHPNLREIILHHDQWTDRGLEVAQQRRLIGEDVYVRVDGVRITRRGLEAVGKCDWLRELDVHGEGLRDEDLELVAGLEQLYDLSVSGQHLTDAKVDFILREYPDLKRLSISNLPPAAVRRLNQLQHLEDLAYVASPLDDAQLIALSELQQVRSLKLETFGIAWITTGDWQVTDAGVRALAKMPSLERFEVMLPKQAETDMTLLRASTSLKTTAVARYHVEKRGETNLVKPIRIPILHHEISQDVANTSDP